MLKEEINIYSRRRVYELAKELNTTSKRIIDKLEEININVRNHMSLLTEDELEKFLVYIGIVNSSGIKDQTKEVNKNKLDLKDRKQFSIMEAHKIINKKQYGKIGQFARCELHIHTPASHDYAFHSSLCRDGQHNGEFHELSQENLVSIIRKEKLLDEKTIDLFDQMLTSEESFLKVCKESNKPFTSIKEYIGYYTIARQLFAKGIKLVLLADHNNIDGFLKLKSAIKDYYESNSKGKVIVEVLLGIEITCSDNNHVVGIFDYIDGSNSGLDQVYKMINELSIEKKEGTYYPSLHVLSKIFEYGGIGYIAHINTSKYSGTGAYKKKLFRLPQMNVIGLTNLEKKDFELNRLGNFVDCNSKNFCFIYESDAHTIDEIGKKNTWIKFSKPDFKSFRKAIEDHGICVSVTKPHKNSKYIKAIIVKPGQYGFLTSKPSFKKAENTDVFCTRFSPDLNCIIGGRGTGKSTILNILDLCLSRNIEDYNILDFISKNEQILIIIVVDSIEYILQVIPQVKTIYDDGTVEYFETAFKDNKKELSNNWFNLYRIKNEQEYENVEKSEAISILNRFYRNGYSINDLVIKIKNKTISDFIKSIVSYGIKQDEFNKQIASFIKRQNIDFEQIGKIQSFIDTNYEVLKERLSQFNEFNSNQLKLEILIEKNIIDLTVKDLENIIYASKRNEEFVSNTFLEWEEVILFLSNVIKKIGLLPFLFNIFGRKYNEIESSMKISSFIDNEKINTALVDKNLEYINEENIKSVYDEIRYALYNPSIKTCILKWIENQYSFKLYFNVNNKESIREEQVLFKHLDELSMGQKVSALLTFIFNYGNFANDNTPLIIDQPEDNLDAQYIYRNLIKSLKSIKNERQVIVVTHCSTIVTNADAEHVMVMESDGMNAWLELGGYPSNEKIVKHIINYLEGGEHSFRNKMVKYSIFNSELQRE